MIGRTALALIALAGSLTAAPAAERIERFVSNVDVRRNGDLLVTETIQVRAEGSQIRRGILRDFPTTYRRRDGSRVEVGFDVQSVTRNGAAEPFTTERMANGVRVRIGSADRTLNIGSHEYVIRYRTTRQIGFFEDYDELYWNATGTGWTFPIDVAEARINLPEGAAFRQWAIYTGPEGATGKDATVVEQVPGRIVFRTTRMLPVRNGLTIAAAWPKGIVLPPTQAQQIQALLQDEPAVIYAGLGGAGVILFYLMAWLLVGRDPPRGTIIPLFAPPDGMSAPAVRYVWRMEFDNRAFTAAVVGLGVKGHLKLVDEGGSQELRHLNGSQPLDPVERSVEINLFKGKSVVPLDNSEHEVINNAKMALMRALGEAYKGKLFNANLGWSLFGFAAMAAVTAAICVAYYNSYGANAGGMLAGTLIPILPIMGAEGAMRVGLSSGRISMLRVVIGLAIIVVSVVTGLAILTMTAGQDWAIVPGAVAWLLALVAARGFSWLRAPTRDGRRIMDQIEGFKQYLGVAEEDRLEYLNPPKKTPELFERFLPYAIALDVQNTWAKRFAGVLAAAGVAAAASTWYTSDSGNSDPVSFADRVGDSLSSTIAAASAPPGSSGGGSDSFNGSSGGGDSGGGGGGGGGSGW